MIVQPLAGALSAKVPTASRAARRPDTFHRSARALRDTLARARRRGAG
ncbi:MAG: hypothetical protein WKG32_04550 [Gemmatimonadaceae bacterium]